MNLALECLGFFWTKEHYPAYKSHFCQKHFPILVELLVCQTTYFADSDDTDFLGMDLILDALGDGGGVFSSTNLYKTL